MKLTGARALLLAAAVLACSACGGGFLLGAIGSGSGGGSSTVFATTVQSVVPPSTTSVTRSLLRTSGSGSKKLGVFAIRGRLHYRASCLGHREVVFNFEHPTPSSKNDESDACTHVQGLQSSLSSFKGGRARISVQAPPGSRWTLVVWETYRPAITYGR